jgi:uncharacterized protein with NAD-binding domain and iron-sulfur cluster
VQSHVVVIGAGRASLTVALVLSRTGYRPLVIRTSIELAAAGRNVAGGRVDSGRYLNLDGRRFSSGAEAINQLWRGIRPRLRHMFNRA